MAAPRADSGALRGLLWASETTFAAELSPDGTVLAANPALEAWAGRALTGSPVTELLAAPQRAALDAVIAGAGAEWHGATFGFFGGGPRAAEDRAVRVRADGDVVLLAAEPAGAEHERLVEQVLELNDDLIRTQRVLGGRQRALEQARAEAQAATLRAAQLEAITLATLVHRDTDDALHALLDVALDVIGSDGACVLLLDDEQPVLAVRAAVGVTAEVAEGVRVPLGTGVAGRIAASGVPVTIDDLSTIEGAGAHLRGQEGSLAGVPLELDGQVIGVLHVQSRRRSAFTDQDLRLLMLVGQRAAFAVGHAQLRDRERRISETLQHSLLPDRLADVPGVAVAARYLPRARGVLVGGDFYDALALAGGRVGVAIGDVAGKGLRAAALMGQLRSALKAYALDERAPGDLLGRLDRFVVDAGDFATAAYVVLEPVSGAVRWSVAGHPPMLHVPHAGPPRLLDAPSSASLGLGSGERPERTAVLAPGDALVLYTDGLVERRRRHLDERLEHLRSAAQDAPRDLDALLDHLLERLADGGPFDDDVALLAVRRTG